MKTIALSLMASAAAGALSTQLQIPQSLLATVPGIPHPPILDVAAALADGTYTGPSVDAYYGRVQVQAVVQSGKIVTLKMLSYPSDRRESLVISQQALPLLRNEVVRAQAAKVDIVSGATLTSQAFIKSLGGALVQAGGAPDTGPAPSPAGPPDNGRRIGI